MSEPAAELLEASLEFFPDYSESSYLLARVYLREQETTRRAIGYLAAAACGKSRWIKMVME
jgi:hypothetical protein